MSIHHVRSWNTNAITAQPSNVQTVSLTNKCQHGYEFVT